MQAYNGSRQSTDYPGGYKSMPTAIHVPSNYDLPAPIRPAVPSYDVAEPVVNMAAGDADKAVKDLITGSIVDIEAEINPEDMIVPSFAESIKLLPHQALGRIWMRDRETDKKTGGILADDMGLGKTIQTLTRIVEGRARKSDAAEGWSASTLVVCPLALVGQWADEIQKMAPGFSVLKHHGNHRTTDPSDFKHHVIITTYDIVKYEYEASKDSAKNESQATLDSDDESGNDYTSKSKRKAKPAGKGKKKRAALFATKWWRVVLDEAHNIKNVKTKGAIACCELQAKYRWCLTGTPLQNNVQELYSLFKFLRIRPLNDAQAFDVQIGKPLTTGRNAGQALKKLRAVLTQVMLRRTKDQTLNGEKLIDLPARNVNVVSCDFDSAEQEFYTALETKMESVLQKLMASDAGNKSYMSVLLLLLRLRQACNHPVLVTKDFKGDSDAIEPKGVKKGASDQDGDADDLVAAFDQLGVTRKCRLCMQDLLPSNTGEGEWSDHCLSCIPLARGAKRNEHDIPSSAKLRKILEILSDIKEQSDGSEKTIIFSQFTSMLDLIEPFLRGESIRYVRYDGKMKPADREASLKKIKEDPKTRVILISFKAGSTGLNLTACNNVILVDLWWNPALEDQAFDRAHRFGQKRDVNIFKLKIDNTIEDRILQLQEKKRMLAQAALAGTKLKDMRLGFDELLALLKWDKDGGGDDSDGDEYD
ncbi:hypothetical protein M378DRAFT_75691 [Amanita muscaria Koide BX008]|uniref:Uncharacterized protein n=1 Tax=Amanita muscaria (strain Koide BX008) TaxID=946122 RepID=A0A0C2WW97_AMAMK|nr:hypothetical protein M378DRAFT_75691 [Amanita muscaria Koide BX008]